MEYKPGQVVGLKIDNGYINYSRPFAEAEGIIENFIIANEPKDNNHILILNDKSFKNMRNYKISNASIEWDKVLTEYFGKLALNTYIKSIAIGPPIKNKCNICYKR